MVIVQQQSEWRAFSYLQYPANDNIDCVVICRVIIPIGCVSSFNEVDGTKGGSTYIIFTATDSSGNTATYIENGPAEIIGVIGESEGDGYDGVNDSFTEDPTR